jgi:hypothetical protein
MVIKRIKGEYCEELDKKKFGNLGKVYEVYQKHRLNCNSMNMK